MSKMTELLEAFIETKGKLMILVPGEGYAVSHVESLVGDVVTIVPEGRRKVMLHYTQVVVRL